MTAQRVFNDYKPEVRALLGRFVKEGFTLVKANNGEQVKFRGDLEAFVTEVTACDECMLCVDGHGYKGLWIHLVLGNEPGVIMADYNLHPLIDKVCDDHYEEWKDKEQPTEPARDNVAAQFEDSKHWPPFPCR